MVQFYRATVEGEKNVNKIQMLTMIESCQNMQVIAGFCVRGCIAAGQSRVPVLNNNQHQKALKTGFEDWTKEQ